MNRRPTLIAGTLVLAMGCAAPCRVGDVIVPSDRRLIFVHEIDASLRLKAFLGECEPGKVPVPRVEQKLPSGQVISHTAEVNQRSEFVENTFSFGQFANVDVRVRTIEVGEQRLTLDFAGDKREFTINVVPAREWFGGRKVPGQCEGPLREIGDELLCNGYFPKEQNRTLTHISTRERVPEVLFELGWGARLWDTPDGLYASYDGGVGRVPRMLADWQPEFPVTEPVKGLTKLGDRIYYVSTGRLCTLSATAVESQCVDAGQLFEGLLPQPNGVVLATLTFSPFVLHFDYYEVRDEKLVLSSSSELRSHGVLRVDEFGIWTSEAFNEKGLLRHTFDGGAISTVRVPVPHGSWMSGSAGDFVMIESNTNVRLLQCPTSLDEQGNFLSFDSIFSRSLYGVGTTTFSAGCTDRSFVIYSGTSAAPTTYLVDIQR